MASPSSPSGVDDTAARLIVTPLVGMAIPNLAGLLDPAANWRAIAMAVVTIVAAVTFITHVYETLFLVREWESDRQRCERLQRLNVEAELLALRSEINPHTLFNNPERAQPSRDPVRSR